MKTDRELFEQALTALETFQGVAANTVIVGKAIESIRARLAELENQTEMFAYARGYEDGKQYVTHKIKRVLDGQPVPASIDCGLFEIKDKSTVTNLNLSDGIYRLLAIRERAFPAVLAQATADERAVKSPAGPGGKQPTEVRQTD